MRANDELTPHIQLGLQCQELRRFDQAEKHFREAVAENPGDSWALHFLASSLHAQKGREREALPVVQEAIALEPNDAFHHALRSFILTSLERPKEALAAAATARQLDPYCEDAALAEAQALLQLSRWSEAEVAAREALKLDADSSSAANLLATALRMQEKRAENEAQIAGLLARDPEDEWTHHNAGWTALQRGDHRTAETHFREALRLDPEFEAAREGLLASFRARSAFYRVFLRYSFTLAKLSEKGRWAFIIGIYLLFRFVRGLARTFSPEFAIGVTALYFIFVLWGFVATGVGNFILLFDRFARYALRRTEALEAIAVGGAVTAGIALLAVGFAVDFKGSLLLGGSLLAAAIPASMVFTNKSRAGSILFGAIALFILLTALFAIGTLVIRDREMFQQALRLLGIGAVGALLSTWLSNVPFFRK